MFKQNTENDELRARFTNWLNKLIYRARLNYLKKQKNNPIMLSLEDIPEENLRSTDIELLVEASETNSFEFEEEKLAKVFYELPLMKQKILIMLFVEEKTPNAIAKKLNCSVQHVYNQRSLAIKTLRILLMKGGEKL
jgi:RNA polymerase sigma factor (sigma-70 family)